MELVAASHAPANRLAGSRAETAILAGFAATLFLSALLLFSVQPMFAKMVLPQLGGSPSVWAVATCFFQAVLFAGYCYAHLLNRYCDARLAPLVHFAVLAIAYAAMPIGLPANLGEPPTDGAYLWLIRVLAAGVGLPFFAVSASAPLLQSWFSRTGSRHADDPYFLYGASNLGSLLALLGYPIFIEPVFGLKSQSWIWSEIFLLLAAAITAAGLVMSIAMRSLGTDVASRSTMAETQSGSPTIADRARWVLFAAVPSGLLVAFTTHISTDIAAAPFLWVIPLAIFLLTFVMVFRDRPLIPHHILLRLQPLLIAVALLVLSGTSFEVWQTSLAIFAAFLVTTLVAHRELFEQRPAASHLTEFYLWMSFGGVVGGIFAAVVAPHIFSATYEFPLLLALGMACRADIFVPSVEGERSKIGLTALVAGVVLAVGIVANEFVSDDIAFKIGAAAVLCGAVVIALSGRMPKVSLAVVLAMMLVVLLLPSSFNRGTPSRSFFGVLRVSDHEAGSLRLFLHGTTMHGAERRLDASGNPVSRLVPATYYHPGSAMARAVDVARSLHTNTTEPFRVGIIGLGIGSMSCYARPDESWRFYEIDAAVAKIATDPTKFRFISTCRPGADIVLGDARLTVAKERSASFDYLQVDAFSSDSVPTHLLTTEAVRMYLDRLAPQGVLAIHVSNKHLDLAPVAVASALAVPGAFATVVHTEAGKDSKFDAAASAVVLVTKSAEAMAPIRIWPEAVPYAKPSIPAWTDDYSDIITALWRMYANKRAE